MTQRNFGCIPPDFWSSGAGGPEIVGLIPGSGVDSAGCGLMRTIGPVSIGLSLDVAPR